MRTGLWRGGVGTHPLTDPRCSQLFPGFLSALLQLCACCTWSSVTRTCAHKLGHLGNKPRRYLHTHTHRLKHSPCAGPRLHLLLCFGNCTDRSEHWDTGISGLYPPSSPQARPVQHPCQPHKLPVPEGELDQPDTPCISDYIASAQSFGNVSRLFPEDSSCCFPCFI